MSDIALKRAYVSDMYPGKNWKHKVDRMSDEQVIAIYLKNHNEGELPSHDEEHVSDEQVDFDDIGTASIGGPGPHHNEDDFPTY
jgi:hypothetical protein